MVETARKIAPLDDGPDWNFDLLELYHQEIARVAKFYRLDTYPNQIEVITAEQMMDAYSSVGMPIGYQHWSFGKRFIHTERNYKRGQMGLAYEIVINSDPCIAYLMEENTMPMQALVMAHACYGHNSFFKNNYLFKAWTDASSIIDYLLFAKNYITECEEKHGIDAVEKLLDSCHALMNFGVDRYKRPQKISLAEEKRRQKAREDYLQTQVNELWRTLPKQHKIAGVEDRRYPAEPQENILYFIEKNAPLLEPWQREVVRIVRKISQYFYPQKQTQVMNEGPPSGTTPFSTTSMTREKSAIASCWRYCTATPTWSISPPTTAGITRGSTPTPLALPCSRTCVASANTRPRRTDTGSPITLAPTGSRHCISPCRTSRTKASSASSSVPR